MNEDIFPRILSATEQVPQEWRGFSSKQHKLSAAADGRRDAKEGLPAEPAYPEWMIYKHAYNKAYNREVARQCRS